MVPSEGDGPVAGVDDEELLREGIIKMDDLQRTLDLPAGRAGRYEKVVSNSGRGLAQEQHVGAVNAERIAFGMWPPSGPLLELPHLDVGMGTWAVYDKPSVWGKMLVKVQSGDICADSMSPSTPDN